MKIIKGASDKKAREVIADLRKKGASADIVHMKGSQNLVYGEYNGGKFSIYIEPDGSVDTQLGSLPPGYERMRPE